MADTLRLKVRDVGLDQVRRFSMPSKAGVASLALLRTFLRTSLGHEPERIFWMDNEQERIALINDSDVAEALRDAGGDRALRLEVEGLAPTVAWPPAVCTFCSQGISGARYLCADECAASVVLCLACGARDDTHPHHRLIKLQQPAHLTASAPPAHHVDPLLMAEHRRREAERTMVYKPQPPLQLLRANAPLSTLDSPMSSELSASTVSIPSSTDASSLASSLSFMSSTTFASQCPAASSVAATESSLAASSAAAVEEASTPAERTEDGNCTTPMAHAPMAHANAFFPEMPQPPPIQAAETPLKAPEPEAPKAPKAPEPQAPKAPEPEVLKAPEPQTLKAVEPAAIPFETAAPWKPAAAIPYAPAAPWKPAAAIPFETAAPWKPAAAIPFEPATVPSEPTAHLKPLAPTSSAPAYTADPAAFPPLYAAYGQPPAPAAMRPPAELFAAPVPPPVLPAPAATAPPLYATVMSQPQVYPPMACEPAAPRGSPGDDGLPLYARAMGHPMTAAFQPYDANPSFCMALPSAFDGASAPAMGGHVVFTTSDPAPGDDHAAAAVPARPTRAPPVTPPEMRRGLTKHRASLQQLSEMGFSDVTVNLAVLEAGDGSVPAAVADLRWAEQLSNLLRMGFPSSVQQLNVLLDKHKGNEAQVIDDLLRTK